MITREQIQSGTHQIFLKTLVNGGPGTGKTFYGLTHPSVAWLITEPGWEPFLAANVQLVSNLAWLEEFIPSPTEDIKAVFDRLNKAVDRAHAEAKEGKVKTLFLDNISFLSENRWIYINQHEKQITAQGSLDTRGMYGALSRWLYQFTLTKILSFPGNVVVSCHEQVEGEEAMASKVDKTTPVVPNILGGFREKVAGMFAASIYLDKKRVGDNKYQYIARCQKGNQRDAKNRYGLPEVIENVSYQKVMDEIKKASASVTNNAAVKAA